MPGLLTVIIGKLSLVAIDGFAFLGAQHLLTVGRPEGLAANLADLLTEGVLSLFGKAILLFFCLLMGFCTVGVAKPLPCVVRIKLFAALFADTLQPLNMIRTVNGIASVSYHWENRFTLTDGSNQNWNRCPVIFWQKNISPVIR